MLGSIGVLRWVQDVEILGIVRKQNEQNGCKSLLWWWQGQESESRTSLCLQGAPILELRLQRSAHALLLLAWGSHLCSLGHPVYLRHRVVNVRIVLVQGGAFRPYAVPVLLPQQDTLPWAHCV